MSIPCAEHGGGLGAERDKPPAFRPDIQGLRAIAVMSVFFYHLWPQYLPGGYVGVDVFFVISGYLITGVLLREIARTGSVSLRGFYQRRIKRLLPAATMTLVGTAMAFRYLPVVTWERLGNETIASTAYVQNWWLASEATDYLAQEDSAGPLQHFWSLSVEEQFYFIWPLLFLAAVAYALRTRRRPMSSLLGCVVVIFLASFIYSVYASHRDPGTAYFATTTRAWELALGGLLAFSIHLRRLSDTAMRVIGGLGLLMIAAACALFDNRTVFPGYAAMLPTLGAACVLFAGARTLPWSAGGILSRRSAQYIGNISYSLYLWHWPVIVYFKQLTNERLGLVDGIVILAISSALAHQSKELVEDRFREKWAFGRTFWQSLAAAGLCMGLSISAGWFVLARHADFEARVKEAPIATALSAPLTGASGDERRISAALRARDDKPSYYNSDCRAVRETLVPKPCVYAPADATLRVALIGDSHAAQWQTAFEELSRQHRWHLSLYAKSACFVGDQSILDGKSSLPYENCDVYRNALFQLLEEQRPDLIVLAQSRGVAKFVEGTTRKEGIERIADAMQRSILHLESLGSTVVLMKDTPWMGKNVSECMSAAKYKEGACDLVFDEPFGRHDPAHVLSERAPSIKVIDMAPHICTETRCRAYVDGLVTYRDGHHLTATFARQLAPMLDAALAPFVPARL